MRRGSVIGPILLILIGAAFLFNNLRPDIPLLSLIGDYWPWLLIAWGAIRLLELTIWKFTGRPLPADGISAGEWAVIVFICFLGASVFFAHRMRDRWPDSRIRMGGLELLGESYDFPLPEMKAPAGRTPRVVVENLRGNARIVGADTEEVRVTGRTTVRAYNRGEAEKIQKECHLEVVTQGDAIIVRTNQDRATSPAKPSSDLELTVPRGATIDARGRHGDFEIADLTGSITVDSDNAGVRISNVGGNVRVETRRSDIIRAVGVKGTVDVKGGGWDVELENITGEARVNGSYTGELTFRNLAKPLHFESSTTNLRVERIPGQLQFSRGDLSGTNLVGPIVLRSRSKDVIITDYTASLEIEVQRGDIEVRPGRVPLAPLKIRTNSGNIEVAVPPSARFEVKAATDRGEIENDYGAPLKVNDAGRGARLEGKVGGGPLIDLSTDRGRIVLGKATSDAPAPPAPPPPPPPSQPKGPKVTQI